MNQEAGGWLVFGMKTEPTLNRKSSDEKGSLDGGAFTLREA